MRLEDISVPEVYKESADFRFFIKWFSTCLSKIQYDTENLIDLYDPLRCPSDLLWLLCDTMGFKFDSRLCPAYNRLVLLYFMSMIYNRGSKTGVTLAAEVNLAQFNIENYGKENEILYDRLEDTSIPVNSVYVNPNVAEGYIDVVYMSTKQPVNACIEYVRPLGMYVFEHAGVKLDARTKVSVDARLVNNTDSGSAVGPTHVGHYRRDDYARMQRMKDEEGRLINGEDKRKQVWYRNSEAERSTNPYINPGYRTLYSLQLSNNEHIVDALLSDPDSNEPIFSLGYEPQSADITSKVPDNYLTATYRQSAEYKASEEYRRKYNLRYDADNDVYSSEFGTPSSQSNDGYTTTPKVNPVMSVMGDAMQMSLVTTDTSITATYTDRDESTKETTLYDVSAELPSSDSSDES